MRVLGNHEGVGRRSPCRAAAMATVALLALAVWAAPAMADRVVTKTGDAFTGTIVEQDPTKVVLKTVSGTMTIPMETIKTIEKGGAVTAIAPDSKTPTPVSGGPTAMITAVSVEPAKAAEARASARAAIASAEWAKAGGLLEGLMALDDKALPPDDRMAFSGALVTCYLQVKDAQGAARSLARRALLATDPNDKKRLLASAEALRAAGSVDLGGKTLTRFEEVVETAMAWKAAQVLKDAKDLAAKAQRLNEMAQLEKAAGIATGKLADADIFIPGYSAAHRKDILEVLVQSILDGAGAAIEHCEKVRPDLTQNRFTSIASRALARAWNDKAIVYLGKRQAGEDALKNIKTFATKNEMLELYTKSATTIATMLEKLDDFQYYPEGTAMHPPSWYGYYGPESPTRTKIQLRRF